MFRFLIICITCFLYEGNNENTVFGVYGVVCVKK